jgi:glycosyltransferase involved in cell wall biosynthesis
LATALGVDDRTQIDGVLAPAQLSGLRTGAVGAVAPSRIDGFSVPVLAGMAHGIPIVASDIPALGEVLGPTGLVVPGFNPDVWAEAFDGLAEDAHLREQLAHGSRSRAAGLSWTHTAAHTCACYAEVRDE